MIEFTTAQLSAWVMSFFWPFVRILAFVGVAPIFGANNVSRLSKIGVAVVLAVAIAPTLGAMPDVPPFSYAGIWLLVQQVIIGIALGLVMRLVFTAVQAAGAYIGLQMGLGFATFFSAEAGTSTAVLSRFLNLFAILVFLAVNGHLIMIRILADTFTAMPVGPGHFNASAWETIARWGGTIFSAGLLLSLPLIAALLAANLAMGILNRASPQLSIFSIGFPVTLLAGLAMLLFMAPELDGLYVNMFDAGLRMMSAVVQTLLAPGA